MRSVLAIALTAALGTGCITVIQDGDPRAAEPFAPSIVSFYRGERNETVDCTGTVLDTHSRQWVLTAAHCVGGTINHGSIAVIGEPGTGPATTVVNVIVHPNYNSQTHEDDVALVQLKDAAADASPPELPDSDPVVDVVEMVGGGVGSPEGMLSAISGNVVGDPPCHVLDGYSPGILKCVAANAGGVRPGDSGGPMLMKNSGTWQLVGVACLGQSAQTDQTEQEQTQYSAFVPLQPDLVSWIRGHTN